MEKDSYNFSKVTRVLEDEIYNLSEYVEYQEKKNIELKNAQKNVSKYLVEDEKVIDTAKRYVKMHDVCHSDKEADEISDEVDELYSKMCVLHMQLCNIAKKYAKTYFPQCGSNHSKAPKSTSHIPEENNIEIESEPKVSKAKKVPCKGRYNASSGINKCIKKKSLLDILKELIYDLNPNSDKTEYGLMTVDDTVCVHDIEFLLSAGIVKRSSENPAIIKLAR